MKTEEMGEHPPKTVARPAWSRRAFIRTGLAVTAAVAAPWPRALAAPPSRSLLELDATDMAAGVKRGDLDPVALVEASRDAIEALNPKLNAVITRFYDHALALAEEARSDHGRPFSGVPYLIKDLSDYEGFRTTFGARVFEQNVSKRTAALAGAAVESGFVPLGKTNTPEYGQLPTTEPLAYGSTPNPWNLAYSSGGSSGGSAVAVASGMVPVALSSDGGGSIRIPSCHCGLFGLKVTRGRNVGANTDPLAMSVRGAVSRTVRDSAGHLVATQQTGEGAHLPPVPLVTGPSKKRLRIGLVMRGIARVDPSDEVRAVVEDTAELCRGLGHTVSDATLPDSAYDMGDALMDVSSARIAGIGAHIEKKLGRRPDERDLEPWTLQMIAEGRERKAEDVEKSRAVLMKMAADTRALVDGFDVLLMPVLSRRAVKLGELQSRPGRTFQELFELNKQYVAYTTLFNVSGNPAMSVPLHWTDDGIPIGSHFAAPLGHEARLLELAYELEQAQPWRDRHPPHSIWSA